MKKSQLKVISVPATLCVLIVLTPAVWAQTRVTEDTVLSADHFGPIEICADNIALDCRRHEIIELNPVDQKDEPRSPRAGILINGHSGVTIRNCRVRDFWRGIVVNGGSNNTLRDNVIVETTPPTIGWTVRQAILLLGTQSNQVSGNVVGNLNGDGIFLVGSNFNTLRFNRAGGPGDAFVLIDSHRNRFVGNLSNGAGIGGNGFYVSGSSRNRFLLNLTSAQRDGFRVESGSAGNEIFLNLIRANRNGILICEGLLSPVNVLGFNLFSRNGTNVATSTPQDPPNCP